MVLQNSNSQLPDSVSRAVLAPPADVLRALHLEGDTNFESPPLIDAAINRGLSSAVKSLYAAAENTTFLDDSVPERRRVSLSPAAATDVVPQGLYSVSSQLVKGGTERHALRFVSLNFSETHNHTGASQVVQFGQSGELVKFAREIVVVGAGDLNRAGEILGVAAPFDLSGWLFALPEILGESFDPSRAEHLALDWNYHDRMSRSLRSASLSAVSNECQTALRDKLCDMDRFRFTTFHLFDNRSRGDVTTALASAGLFLSPAGAPQLWIRTSHGSQNEAALISDRLREIFDFAAQA